MAWKQLTRLLLSVTGNGKEEMKSNNTKWLSVYDDMIVHYNNLSQNVVKCKDDFMLCIEKICIIIKKNTVINMSVKFILCCCVSALLLYHL